MALVCLGKLECNVINYFIVSIRKKSVSQVVSGKEPANQCRRLDPWVRKIPWRRERATHSSILAWRIPWTGEPGRLQTTESHRVRHGWSDLAGTHTYTFGKNENYTIGRGKKKKNLCMYSAGRERPHVGIGKHNLLQGWPSSWFGPILWPLTPLLESAFKSLSAQLYK